MTLKIKILSDNVTQNPTNLVNQIRLVSAFLEEGDEEGVRSTLARALVEIKKDALLPERFHKPLIKAFKEFFLAGPLEMLCRDLEIHYGEEFEYDEALKRMVRQGRKAVAESLPHPVMNPKTKGEDWWQHADVFPYYIYQEGTKFYFYVIGHDDDNFLEQTKFEWEDQDLNAHGFEAEQLPLRGFYKDGNFYA